MSFSSEYNELRRKRKKQQEEGTQKVVSGNPLNTPKQQKVISGNPLKKSTQDIAPVRVVSTFAPVTSDTELTVPILGELDLFQEGALKSGVTAENVGKAILGTAGDIALGGARGVMRFAEGIGDAINYGIAGVSDLLGADDWAEGLRNETKKSVTDQLFGDQTQKVAKWSVLGESSRNFTEQIGNIAILGGLGNLGKVAGLGKTGITALTTGTMGASGVGSGMSEAYQGGATDGQALKHGLNVGTIEALSELLFDGMGSAIRSTGFSQGITSIDDVFAKKVSNQFTSQFAKNVAEYSVKAGAEGIEEIVAGVGNILSKKFTLMSDKDWLELIEDENLLEQFFAGTLSSGFAQSYDLYQANKSGTDFISGLTQDEQSVVDKVVEDRVAEKEAKGETVSNKDKNKIYDSVVSDLNRGYIGTDTINEMFGGEAYTNYKALAEQQAQQKASLETEKAQLQSELEALENANNTIGNANKYNDAKSKLEDIESKLEALNKKSLGDAITMNSAMHKRFKGTKLGESYNEWARSFEGFKADYSKFKDAKHQDAVKQTLENAEKSGMANTNKMRDLVEMNAKFSADTGVVFKYKSGEEIKNDFIERQTAEIKKLESITERTPEQSKLLAELKETLEDVKSGKLKVNGNITADGIEINLNSPEALNFVTGHEITHNLEKLNSYTELVDSLKKFAGKDFDKRVAKQMKIYKGVSGYDSAKLKAEAEKEVVADLVGEYLFSDEKFINSLSTENPNLFKRIYNEIKYLCKIATAGSREARELERVKRAFEKAYKESANTKTDTKADTNINADTEVTEDTHESNTKYSLVTDEDTIAFLENQDYVVTYKAMQVIDGKLYPPMSAEYKVEEEYTNKKGEKKVRTVKKLKQPSELGKWQQSEENVEVAKQSYDAKKGYSSFELLKGDGKSLKGVAYNPYEHTSNIVLNDQFSSAHRRDNLVTVEYHIPVSELTSGYKAEYSKDAVGKRDWHTGLVASNLKNTKRDVYLTRWSKPVRVLSDSEVAQKYKEILDKEDGVAVPWNVVTQSLREELEKAGVPIDYSDKKIGTATFNFEASLRGEYLENKKNSKSKANAKYSLSEGQQEYFKDSVVRDDNGNLKVMYHGTSKGGHTVFDTFGESRFGLFGAGTYFTDNKDIANSYTEKGRGNSPQVYEAYLNITNPIDMDAKADIDAWKKAFADADYTNCTTNEDCFKAMKEVFVDEQYPQWEAKDTAMDVLQSMGYDGITHIGGGRVNADGTRHQVYIAFEPEQIKNIDNIAPTKDADIRYSLTDIEGKPIEEARITTDESDVKYSLKFNSDIAEGQSKYIANHRAYVTEDELAEAQRVTNAMVDVMMKYSNILPEDKIGKVLTKNGSYDRSVENTTICVRTLAYNEFVDKVQEEIGRPLTQMESFLVSQKLYDIATEPQCLYCYVSLDRKAFNDMLLRYMQDRDTVIAKYNNSDKSPEAINKLYEDFLNGRKDTKPMKDRFNTWLGYVDNGTQLLSLADISTEDRQSVIKANGGNLAEQLKDARKYAQSASWSKIQKNYVAYRDEILKLGDRVVKNLNEHYGLRWYSFSDYSPAFIVENMQQITDASIRGLKGLSYTKDTDFAEVFAPSGMNINISVFVNQDADGNFFIDEKQSANFERAKELRGKYPNVGIVATVTNDDALKWAGSQEWSDVIIPFHIVRTGTDVAEYYKWLNYTSESADTIKDKDIWNTYLDSLNLKSENARKKVSKNIYPNEHNNDKATYLALCESRGLSPRFVRFAGEDWYMKLVNETRLSANESSVLKPVYDLEKAQASFEKFVKKGGYEGGWYKNDVDVDAESKIVADDVLAGKKANEVDYGRQDGFVPESLIAKRKKIRTHSRYSLSTEKDIAPTFYSQMGRVVEGIKQDKIGASSVVNYLKGKGVKNEEIKWSGIEEFVEGKKSVTKQELQEFVANSMLQIEEKQLGGHSVHDLWKAFRQFDYDLEESDIVVDDDFLENMENYLQEALDEETIDQNEYDRLMTLAKNVYEEGTETQTNWHDYKLNGGSNYREILFKMPNSHYYNDSMMTHWKGETGVLAHARVQDLVDNEGKKVLFIEEIQSDWHNEGAKQGYQDEKLEAKKSLLAEKEARFKELDDKIFELKDQVKNGEITQDDYRDITETFRKEYTNLYIEVDNLREEVKQGKKLPPDAPFKDNYHEFVLKNLLREATEKGYDKIAWTTGKIQERRWSDEFAEGYRIEYDQDIPKFLNKYGKKWGAKVGTTYIPTEIYHQTEGNEGLIAEIEGSIQELEYELANMGDDAYDNDFAEFLREGIADQQKTLESFKGTRVWSMDITDSMKNSVLYEGQPFYSLSREGELHTRGYSDEIRYKQDIAPVVENTTVESTPVVENVTETAPIQEAPTREFEAIKPRPEKLVGEEEQWAKNKMARADKVKRVKAKNTEYPTNDSKEKQRKWVGTSTNSDVVNREILPEDLDQSKITYQPISNKVTLRNANTRLDSLGYDDAVTYFNGQFTNRQTTLDDIALGERLIQEAMKRGDTKTAGELIQNVAILGTELGQKVQALSIIKRLTPEGQLRMLQKTVERGKTKGDKSFEGVELTQEMIDKILKTYGKDGTYNQDELNAVVEDVKRELAEQMKVTALEKVNAWRYLSMLGNPKTHIRNLVSNIAMKGTVATKNAVARTLESIAPIGNRTKTWKRSTDVVKKFAEQTTTEMKDIISGDNKYSENESIKSKRDIFKNKILNSVYEFNSDMLTKEDWWFSKPAFKNSFSEFLTANGIETMEDIQNNPEIVEKGKLYALDQSQIATFRQYSWLANKINEIERKNTATNIAVGSILPFKKTPINIAKTGLNYSLLGFAKTLAYDTVQVKKGNMEASEMIDHLAQNITGSSLTLVGFMLASAGFLNGSGDDDEEGKYDYQLGEQAYSVTIGDATFSLSWLSPVAMPLFVGANAYEQLVEKKDWNGDVVVETLSQTLDPLSEMSFLSSLDSVLSSYDSGIKKFAGIGEAMAQNYITQFAPTLGSQIATVFDDTKRSTKIGADSEFKPFDSTVNKLVSKIPFLRGTLEPSIDIWGNDVKQTDNLLTRAFESFLAPYSKREDISTSVDDEIKAIYKEVGDSGLIPSIPDNYINYKNEKYEMSASEYTTYKKTYGQTANSLFEGLFSNTAYLNATTEEKAEMILDVYDYARDEAKREYLAGKGVEYTNATSKGEAYYKENPIKGAIENNMTPEEYDMYSRYPEKYAVLQEQGISVKEYKENYEETAFMYTDDFDWASKNPEKYTLSKAITSDVMEYKQYTSDLNNIHAGKDTKRQKKEYIYNLDIDEGAKYILIKKEYPSDDSHNDDILYYLNSRDDLTYEDRVTILEELGATVDDEGYISWD